MKKNLYACPSCRNVMAPKALVLRCRSGTPLLFALIIIVTRRAKQRMRSGPCRLVAVAYAYNQQRPLACVLVTTSSRDYGLSSSSTASSYRPWSSSSSYKPSYYGSSRY